MAKYYINVRWRDGLWRWEILKHPRSWTVEASGQSSWRWLAKRRALSALMDIKAQQEEDERNEAREIHLEVDI